MARTYHYRRHLVEAHRNRLRLAIAIGLIVIATAIVAVPSVISHAATASTADLDGAKISSVAGGTYGGALNGTFSSANIAITRISNGVAVNSAANPFSFTGLGALASGDRYLVSVPPSPGGGYSIKGLTWCEDACVGYDPQSTNFQPGSVVNLFLYPNHFYHVRVIYNPDSAAVAAPVPTPTPNAASANVVTPGNFQALVAGDNALVALSWTAPPAAVGGQSYRLERSIDTTNWTVVADGLATLAYRDDTVTFGVHYYYRLRSKDSAGNPSGYAYAEATTVSFSANSASTSDGTYMSDDQVATVVIPAGALDDSADCSVTASTETIPTLADQTLVAGPYSLVCKDVTGVVTGDFNKPVIWRFALGAKLKGLVKPVAKLVDTNGTLTGIEGAAFDSTTHILEFNQLSASTVAVFASASTGIDPSVLGTVVVLLVLVAGVIVVVLRNAQKGKYYDYIRKKYYDI
jgi:hypothetical protein